MINSVPAASDIINASATATTTGIVSVPANRWFTADIQLATSLTLAGTSAPFVSYVWNGGTTGAAPSTNSVLARIEVQGLALVTICDSDTTETIVYGGTNGCTLNFTAGAVGTSSVVINGFLI